MVVGLTVSDCVPSFDTVVPHTLLGTCAFVEGEGEKEKEKELP